MVVQRAWATAILQGTLAQQRVWCSEKTNQGWKDPADQARGLKSCSMSLTGHTAPASLSSQRCE